MDSSTDGSCSLMDASGGPSLGRSYRVISSFRAAGSGG